MPGENYGSTPTPESPSPSKEQHPQLLSTLRLAGITSAMAGVFLGWGAQVGGGSSMLSRVGVSDALVSLVWLFGPVSGFTMAPVVGKLSDDLRTRWGRRRPVIVGFATLAATSMICFALSLHVKHYAGHTVGVCWAVLFFASMDFTINGVTAPLRALVVDQAPATQQARANSYFCFWGAGGQMVGYLLGGIFSSEVVFVIGAGIFLITVTVCCHCAEESLPAEVQDTPDESLLSQLAAALQRIPQPMAKMWICQFWSFFSLFTIMVNGVNFFAQELVDGDSTAPEGSTKRIAYSDGCHSANMAFFWMVAMGFLVSFLAPALIEKLGVRTLEMVNLGVSGVCLMALSLCVTTRAAQFMFVLLGVSWGLTSIVPWYAFSVMVSNMPNKGATTGIFNWSQCLPEVAVSLLGVVVLQLDGSNIRAMLILGSLGSVAGFFCTFALTEPTAIPEYSQIPREEHEPATKDSSVVDSKSGANRS